jgi:hypothetical protein
MGQSNNTFLRPKILLPVWTLAVLPSFEDLLLTGIKSRRAARKFFLCGIHTKKD